MTTFVLEMRSTENWSDVRYRTYTTSKRQAALFKRIPKLNFTDSGHGLIPVVNERVFGKPRLPRINLLEDYVRVQMKKGAAGHP